MIFCLLPYTHWQLDHNCNICIFITAEINRICIMVMKGTSLITAFFFSGDFAYKWLPLGRFSGWEGSRAVLGWSCPLCSDHPVPGCWLLPIHSPWQPSGSKDGHQGCCGHSCLRARPRGTRLVQGWGDAARGWESPGAVLVSPSHRSASPPGEPCCPVAVTIFPSCCPQGCHQKGTPAPLGCGITPV